MVISLILVKICRMSSNVVIYTPRTNYYLRLIFAFIYSFIIIVYIITVQFCSSVNISQYWWEFLDISKVILLVKECDEALSCMIGNKGDVAGNLSGALIISLFCGPYPFPLKTRDNIPTSNCLGVTNRLIIYVFRSFSNCCNHLILFRYWIV